MRNVGGERENILSDLRSATMTLLKMPKPIPDNEADRTAEAAGLMNQLTETDIPKMTSWEVELVVSLREGKACTRIRLKELRELVARLYPPTP